MAYAPRRFRVFRLGSSTVLERVNLKRKPQVDFDAIYFLTPRKESVVAMTTDFERGNRLYSKAHVFFTTGTAAASRRWSLAAFTYPRRSHARQSDGTQC